MKPSQPSDFAARSAEIGRRLREAYAELRTEPVPHHGCALDEMEKRWAQAGLGAKEEKTSDG